MGTAPAGESAAQQVRRRAGRASALALGLLAGLCASAAGAGQAPAGALNDTGLDWWATGSTNYLTSEPAAYPGQDASHGRDATHDNDADGHAGFSFTKLDGNGNPLPANASAWSCVRDEVTGLVWEAKTDDGGLRDKDWTYTWYSPDASTNGGSAGTPDGTDNCYAPARCDTHKYAADVNAAGLCGAANWRLPTREELRSLVDYSRYGPAIDTTYFPDIGPSYWWWSSSPYASSAGGAWVVNFGDGGDGGHDKGSHGRVRLVRGGQALGSGGSGLVWPLAPSTALPKVTQDYGCRGTTNLVSGTVDDVCFSNDKYHTGIDMVSAASDGTVRAAGEGTVVTKQTNGDNDHGLGNAVVIHHEASNLYTLYAHLASFSDGLEVGHEVIAGQELGQMGGTGYGEDATYAVHLHFEVKTHPGLGSSSGTDFGYVPSKNSSTVPGHPSAHGFLDPWAHLAGTALAPTPLAVTNPAGVYVRRGPRSPDYSALTELSAGRGFVAFARHVEGSDVWYRVHLPCGNGNSCAGWVAGTVAGNTYSELRPASTQLEVFGTGTLGLNVRSDPGGSKLDKVYDGQRFVYTDTSPPGNGCASAWYRIDLPLLASGAAAGWVCGDYARVVGSAQGAVLSLQGQVREGGMPKAGVSLALSGTATGSTTSDATGYGFASLASGAYTVTPSLAGYQFSPASRSVTLSGASQSGVDFRACHAATPLTVTLTDANGRALSGATVSAGGLTATEVAAGQYQIAGLGCTGGSVSVTAPGYPAAEQTFDRFAGAALALSLTAESAVAGVQHQGGIEGDPVNTATGNYIYQRRDLALPGIGLPFQLDRAYNSREASKAGAGGTPLGYGWTHSYHVRLAVDPGGTATLTWGDGRTETYAPDGAGGYTPPSGVFSTLSESAGLYTLTRRDRSAYRFDAGGRLASIADKNGNTLTFNYTAGSLTSIVDTAGRTVALAYDASGRLTQVTDPIGRTVRYAYDGNGDLVSASDPEGHVTRYTYDAEHQVLTVLDPRGHTVVSNTYDAARRVVTYQTDAKGGATTYSYQELDRVTTIEDALGQVTVHHHDSALRLVKEEDARGGVALYEYDAAGNRVRVTDKNGNAIRYGYDARGNVTSRTDALGNVTNITYDADDNPLTRTDALGNLTRFEYDARGNLTRTTDALGGVTTVTYDARGLPLTVTDPLGHVTTSAYDAQGNLAQVTDALGNVTTYTYDGVGRRLTQTAPLARTTTFAYDGNDHLLTVTDPAGHTLTHAYDGNGNRIRTTDRRGGVTQWAYDEKDLVVSETDALGQVERYTYDALDRRLTRTDRRGHVTTSSYDAVGNLIEVTDPLGQKTTSSYDLAGNRLTTTDALGRTTTYQYDALNRVTRVKDPLGQATLTSYDANGNRLTLTDARGNVTQYAYDALNRLVQVTDPLGHTRQSAYDAAGNRVSVTDALGHTTTFTYDALNRPVAETDALGHTRATAYDAAGRVSATTDANGRATTFGYDALDRLAEVIDAAGGTVQYTYDPNGNRLSLTDPNGHTTTYAYDALNRRTRMTEALGHVTAFAYDAVGNLSEKTDPKGQVVRYSYDALDRRTGIDYPAQPDVAFGYNAVGNLVTMTDGLGTTTHAYDALGRRTRTTDPFGQPVDYGYDANGNRTRLTYPGARTVSYAYDAANRMTSVTDWLGNSTSYSYDAADRLTGATNANGTTTTYGYDAASRLTALTNATAFGSVINAYQYTLDPVGNHLVEDRTEPLAPALPPEVVADTHDAENRLLTRNGTPNTFDANGNLTAKGANSFVYDASDRLVGTSIAGTTTFYQYDGLGNRYRRTRGGVETRFVLDTNTSLTNVLAETDATGAVQAWNVYGQGLIARILADGSVLQYHYDSRGSTIALTDAAGAPVQQYAYDPFGRTTGSAGSEHNPFGFLGSYGVLNDGDELHFARARYYDSRLQRFTSKDPLHSNDWNSQTLNRFVYALNNPLVRIDPLGLYSWKTAGVGALQVLAGVGGIASATLITVAAAAGGPVTGPAGIASAAFTLNDASKQLAAAWTNIRSGQEEWVEKDDFPTPLDEVVARDSGIRLLRDVSGIIGLVQAGQTVYGSVDRIDDAARFTSNFGTLGDLGRAASAQWWHGMGDLVHSSLKIQAAMCCGENPFMDFNPDIAQFWSELADASSKVRDPTTMGLAVNWPVIPEVLEVTPIVKWLAGKKVFQ
jgi:RHS repeat-associated protein